MHRLRIVLVRPQIAGNIGAVARCMENFGAGPLYLVEPKHSPTSRESMQRSTHGEHRLHSARVVSTLAEALEGTIYAIGTSRRPGPVHQEDDLTPRQMGEIVAERLRSCGTSSRLCGTGFGSCGTGFQPVDECPEADQATMTGKMPLPHEVPVPHKMLVPQEMPVPHEVALLFGSEDNGLSREDLLACDAVVVIPANPAYPTLNLSHAAAICMYEVFLAAAIARHTDGTVRKRSEPADLAMMARLIDKLQHALLTVGYLRPEKPDHLMFPIRAILSRADLSRSEAQILMGLAQQIDEFAKYGGPRASD